MPRSLRIQRRSRDGSYGIILAISLPVLLGMSAIAVDLSYQKVVRAELQAASDIASAAGAAELDGTYEGFARAKDAAIRAAARNNADGDFVPLAPGDIEFGYWDRDTWSWTPTDDPELADSMQVRVRRAEVGTSFAGVAFSRSTIAARAGATALQPPDTPAGAVGCYLPLAVPQCLFETHTTEELSQLRLVLNPSGVDNVGWARAGDYPNANWLRDQINDCQQDGRATVGDSVGLQNGVAASVPREIVDAMKHSDVLWDTPEWGEIPAQNDRSGLSPVEYGQVIEGSIIVFESGPEYCEGMGGGYNGMETIVGFAWAVIYDVRRAGGAAEQNIWVKLDPNADQNVGIIGGGLVDGGVDYDEPIVIVK